MGEGQSEKCFTRPDEHILSNQSVLHIDATYLRNSTSTLAVVQEFLFLLTVSRDGRPNATTDQVIKVEKQEILEYVEIMV